MGLECNELLVVKRPYAEALRRIRTALNAAGLQITFELDIAGSIFRSTGVQLARSALLGVACPYQLLEACVADLGAVVFLPLHIIVTERGDEAEVRFIATETLRAAAVTTAISIPVYRTQSRIRNALTAAGAHFVDDGSGTGLGPGSPAQGEMSRS